jgi:hypothetical protein
MATAKRRGFIANPAAQPTADKVRQAAGAPPFPEAGLLRVAHHDRTRSPIGEHEGHRGARCTRATRVSAHVKPDLVLWIGLGILRVARRRHSDGDRVDRRIDQILSAELEALGLVSDF